MKPYTSDEINAAIARVETAKQNYPRGWRYLEELNLGNADAFVMYAFRNADLHMKRLEGEDRRLIYSSGWLNGLSLGVAIAEERTRELLEEVAGSGVSFQDPRVSYLEVQINRVTWDELEPWRKHGPGH